MTLSDAPDATRTIRDRYFAPSVLAPFADDMARRLSRLSIGPLLEIYADGGALTQAMASTMSVGLSIIATDPGPETIAHASLNPGMARITWETADPAALRFPAETFGIVTSLFGVPVAPNRVNLFREIRRVLKPGGRFVFSVPGHMRQNQVAGCVHEALELLFPGDPPRFLADVLHGYADNEAIDDDLTAAGFTDAIYTSVEVPFVAASAHDVAIGYCLGTPLRHEIQTRAGGDTDRVLRAVATALQNWFGKGLVEASMRATIISAAG